MTPTAPPSSPEVSDLRNRIKALVVTQDGRSVFKLNLRGEIIPLLDSSSLNRWAAAGIIERHKLVVTSDGVTVDGHHLRYDDPKAGEALEAMLNKPAGSGSDSGRSSAHAVHATGGRDATGTTLEGDGTNFANAIRVTRDGFEFHVTFRTRFGEHKTEKLEPALEIFQRMRAFKPHLNMQKSGIRLVVTRWDGESFVEEHGIENLEHASPAEVESLIRTNLQGGAEAGGPTHPPAHFAKAPVARVSVLKAPHDARFHLVLHRNDGLTEDGPLLIRPNMGKLAAERVFRPDVAIAMTALNDQIIIERKIAGRPARSAETFPLSSLEDAARVEAILNTCLRRSDPGSGEELPSSDDLSAATPPAVIPSPPNSASAASPPPALIEGAPVAAPDAPGADKAGSPLVDAGRTSPAQPEAAAEPAGARLIGNWRARLLAAVKARPIDEVNAEVFTAIRDRFDLPICSNDHGFPAYPLEVPDKDGTRLKLELVLTPHYLLCHCPAGYLRFGAETRFFLTRLDDYIAFPGPGLVGIAEQSLTGELVFIISEECARFLHSNPDRNYRGQFQRLLRAAPDLVPTDRLLWPLAREDRLYQMAAATAKAYGLPVTADRIVLAPNAPVFIGFTRVAPHGVEFRDADDFVRFTPVSLEMTEDGKTTAFAGQDLLLGWALDQEGRVCAILRADCGFSPPDQIKLLRFITEQEKELDGGSLTLLAFIGD